MGIEKRFLIIKLSAIGDIVHTLPVVDCLKTFYPDSRIDWVVSDKLSNIIKNHPLIDNIYEANLSDWRKNWLTSVGKIAKFNKRLQENHYDYVIDFQGLFKSAVITAFSGGKQRIGYSDGREFSPLAFNLKIKPKEKRPYKNWHVIKRYLDLLVYAGIITQEQMSNYKVKSMLPASSDETVSFVNGLLKDIDITKPIVVFAPATTWMNKHWDITEWQKLYEALKFKTNIIFTGIEKDKILINNITNNDSNCNVAAGKTNMKQYIELLRRADLIISPDSGACHLGFALKNDENVPRIITIFCATSKECYKSLDNNDLAFPLGEPVCAPCHKRKCKLGTMKCTNFVRADEVYKHVCLMLNL